MIERHYMLDSHGLQRVHNLSRVRLNHNAISYPGTRLPRGERYPQPHFPQTKDPRRIYRSPVPRISRRIRVLLFDHFRNPPTNTLPHRSIF